MSTKGGGEAVIASDKLSALTPLRGERLDELHAALVAAMLEFGITNSRRSAAFLAQTSYESQRFTRTVENLNYTTAARLMAVWPSRFRTEAAARPYVRQPEKLANFVYGGRKDLGNTEPGDGWRFRGRSFIMTTGRGNYTKLADALGLPLVERPEMLEIMGVAARAAGYFWNSHGLNPVMDDPDQEEAFAIVTKTISGSTRTLGDRRAIWMLARRVLCA